MAGCLLGDDYHLSLGVRSLDESGPVDGNVTADELADRSPHLLAALQRAQIDGDASIEGRGPVNEVLAFLRATIDEHAPSWILGFEGDRFEIDQIAM